MKKSSRFFAIVLLALIMAVATYAFAAANTMPASSSAGDGQTGISGYTISNVHYNLNAGNPANIDSVTFTIAPAMVAGGSVQAQLVTGGTWFACTGIPGANISCTTTGVTALAANNLRVIAAQ
jgi:hypothetical protein